VDCLDQSSDSFFPPPPSSSPIPVEDSNFDSIHHSCDLFGKNYTGVWKSRKLFTITAGDFNSVRDKTTKLCSLYSLQFLKQKFDMQGIHLGLMDIMTNQEMKIILWQ
jgi:hypothetical protein